MASPATLPAGFSGWDEEPAAPASTLPADFSGWDAAPAPPPAPVAPKPVAPRAPSAEEQFHQGQVEGWMPRGGGPQFIGQNPVFRPGNPPSLSSPIEHPPAAAPPATFTPTPQEQADMPPAPAAQPAAPRPPDTLQRATISPLESLRETVADSAIGHALAAGMPGVSKALHLEPTEAFGTPEYEQHGQQLINPEPLVRNAVSGELAQPVPHSLNLIPSLMRESTAEKRPEAQNILAGGAEAAGAMTTPGNLLLMGAPIGDVAGLAGEAAEKVVPRLLSAGFTVQMIQGLSEQAKAYKRAKAAGDDTQAEELLGQMALTAPMIFMAGAHAAGAEHAGVPHGTVEHPEIGAEEPETGRTVMQQSPRPEVTQAAATAEHPAVKQQLEDAVAPIKGAKVAGARDEKTPERLEEKIEGEGQSPRTVRDYSGFRIAVDSPAARDEVANSLRQRFEVPDEQDEFEKGNDETGFHGLTLQVREPGSPVSHEVQILPREVAENADARHGLYEQAREGDKAAMAKLKEQNESDYQKFLTRNGEKGGRGQSPEQPGGAAPVFKHGSTQANIPEQSEAGQALAGLRAKIASEDLAGNVNGTEGGLETQPHVTVRYGVKGDDVEGIKRFLESQKPFEASLGATHTFPASEHSDGAVPVVAPVESPELHRINSEIEEHGEFAASSFPEYKPHATVAYVKPGAAEKYVGLQDAAGRKFLVDHIAITDRNGNQTNVPLLGKPAENIENVQNRAETAGAPATAAPESLQGAKNLTAGFGEAQPGMDRTAPTENAENKAAPGHLPTASGGPYTEGSRVLRYDFNPEEAWEGFDLDKTLAHDDGYQGPEHIGAPIPEAIDRLKQKLAEGKKVRILTARVAHDPDGTARRTIEKWAEQHIGEQLPITAVKDPNMTRLYDDRAATVEPNTGRLLAEPELDEKGNDALRERGAGGVLQRPPEEAGAGGGERGRVEPGEQRPEAAGAQPREEEAARAAGAPPVVAAAELRRPQVRAALKERGIEDANALDLVLRAVRHGHVRDSNDLKDIARMAEAIGDMEPRQGPVAAVAEALQYQSLDGLRGVAEEPPRWRPGTKKGTEYDHAAAIRDRANEILKKLGEPTFPEMPRERLTSPARQPAAAQRTNPAAAPRVEARQAAQHLPAPESREAEEPEERLPGRGWVKGDRFAFREPETGRVRTGEISHYSPATNGGKAGGRAVLEGGERLDRIPENAAKIGKGEAPVAAAMRGSEEHFARGLDEARGRSLRENAAAHKARVVETDAGKAVALDPDAYALWHRSGLGRKIAWRGVNLPKAFAYKLELMLRADAGGARATPGGAEAAAGYDRLVQAIRDARRPDGSVMLLRGDFRPDTVREEAWHAWTQRHGIADSEALEKLADQPLFRDVADRLREAGYGVARGAEGRREIALEMTAKALAGDPDLPMTDEQRFDLVHGFLRAAADEHGSEIFDDMPPVAPEAEAALNEARRSYETESDEGGHGRPVRGTGAGAGPQADEGPISQGSALHPEPRGERAAAGNEGGAGAAGEAEGQLTRGQKRQILRPLLQRVFHGTPFKFDRFTLDHIGEGEGAQAYGWGLYFAGDRGVAEYYRREITRSATRLADLEPDEQAIADHGEKEAELQKQATDARQKLYASGLRAMGFEGSPDDPIDERTATRLLNASPDHLNIGTFTNEGKNLLRLARSGVSASHWLGAFRDVLGDEFGYGVPDREAGNNALFDIFYNAAPGESRSELGSMERQLDEAQGNLSALRTGMLNETAARKSRGHLYTAEIPEGEEMLDWGRNMWNQPDAVKQKLLDAGLISGKQEFAPPEAGKVPMARTGEAFYEGLAQKLGSDKAASEYLRKLGIKGIRYLDANSRTAGEGTHNYVVFDDDAVKILDRFESEVPLYQRAAGKGVRPEDSLLLPGMENADTEREAARGEAEGKLLSDEMLRPKGDISGAAGRMERESPLFHGTGENPSLFGSSREDEGGQGTLFQKGPGEEGPVAKSVQALIEDLARSRPADNRTALERVADTAGTVWDDSTARAAAKWRQAPSKLQQVWGKAKAVTAALVDGLRHPLQTTDWKHSVGQMDLAKLETALKLHELARQMKAAAPDRLSRIAMTHWAEAGGDPAKLREWADGARARWNWAKSNPDIDPRLKDAYYEAVEHYDKAHKLTDQQKLVAQQVKSHLDDMLQIGRANGLLEYGARNYVRHLYEQADAADLLHLLDTNEISPNPGFIQQRVFRTYYEAEGHGMVPRNKDIGYLVTAYDKSFNQALASRAFLRSLLDGRARDGRPLAAIKLRGKWLVATDDQKPLVLQQRERPADLKGYREFDLAPTRNFLFEPTREDLEGFQHDPKLFEEDPERLVFKGDLIFHPEVADRIQDMLTPGWFDRNETWPQKIGHAMLKGSAVAKEMMTMMAPFHLVQLGEHSVEHWVNPTKLPEIDVSGKGEESRKQRLLASNGLNLVDFDAEGLFSAKALKGLTEGVPGLNVAMGAVDSLSRWQFENIIPRMKMKAARIYFDRNWDRYGDRLEAEQLSNMGATAKSAPQIRQLAHDTAERMVAELSAKQANASFGNLNTDFDAVHRSKTFKQLLRLTMFAPDFLESRIRYTGQAFNRYGGEQRAALLRGALGMYMIARIANYVLNKGDMKMDPEHAFTVVAGGRNFSLRSQEGDILHLVTDPRGFIYNRMNPLTTTPLVEFLSGRDQFGRQLSYTHQMENLAKRTLPFGVQKVIETSGEGWLDSILSSTGLNASNYRTPAEEMTHKLYLQNIPDLPDDPDRRAMSRARFQMEQQLREGKIKPAAVLQAAKDGKMSFRQAWMTIERSRHSELYNEFASGAVRMMPAHRGDPSALDIFAKANPAERLELRGALMRKGMDQLPEIQDKVARDELVKEWRQALQSVPHEEPAPTLEQPQESAVASR